MIIETIKDTIKKISISQMKEFGEIRGINTQQLAETLNLQRANVSRDLSKLFSNGEIKKKKGKPVLYYVEVSEEEINTEKNVSVFDKIIQKSGSLKNAIALAKAAVVYPPKGLHTLIVGETGVGKSFFAKCMNEYASEVNRTSNNRFIVFNCADYSNNPQLLISHLFGVKKGAYTGALEDREGIIEQGRNGIVFLDEIHRLPPEGQEMLFTLIDEGKFTPLGSTEEIDIDVMLICATTENIDSSLLKTFTRRIPVSITLPPLRERKPEERLAIIRIFIDEEMKRVDRDIRIEDEALTALMNYNCPNNIGQLKSDIQIACAKAFLRNMTSEGEIKLKLEDFSDEVKSGILKSKKIYITDMSMPISGSSEHIKYDTNVDKYNVAKNIYDFIEKKSEELSSKGLSEDEIKESLNGEVEIFINRYMNNIKHVDNEDDLKRLVNNELYELVENFMFIAEYKLKRKISRNTFLGLLFHVNIFLARIKENREVVNPKIDEIRKKYSQEFKLAMKLAEKLEDKYKITVPFGEIGFIAMFFAVDRVEQKKRVSVIVAMHGNSTASSMSEVANHLLKVDNVKSYNMPLSVSPEKALEELTQIVKENHEGKGTLLIVDMGSLKYLGEIIEENTGIPIRTIDMASTPIVVEASRKALVYEELDEIVMSIRSEENYLSGLFYNPVYEKKDIIVTACITGEGTALKLKDIIKEKYNDEEYEIINLSIQDKENFRILINKLRRTKKVKCIISAIDPEIEGIPYISMEELFEEFFGKDSMKTLDDENMISKIKGIYKEYMNLERADFVVDSFIEVLVSLRDYIEVSFNGDVFMGLMMHYGSMVERLINNDEVPKCEKLQFIKSRYSAVFETMQKKFAIIERELDIKISEDDIGNIVELVLML